MTTGLMGLIIMQASKNFKSQRPQRIFGGSNIILKTFVKHVNNQGMSGYSISARIYLKGVFMWQRTARQQAQSIFGTIEKTSGYLVITRSMGDDRMNGKCKQFSIRIYRWSGIAKVMGTKSRENIREYLRNLLMQQAILCSKGLSGWMRSRDPNLRVSKFI